MNSKRGSEKSDKSKKITNGNLNNSPEKFGSDKRRKKPLNKNQQFSETNSNDFIDDTYFSKEKTGAMNSDDSFYDDLVGFYGENDYSRPEGVLELKIPNISKYKEMDFRSETKILSPEPSIIRCLPWKILFMLRMHQDRTQKSIGFFLQCNAKSESTVWHCYSRAELRLVAQRPPVTQFNSSHQAQSQNGAALNNNNNQNNNINNSIMTSSVISNNSNTSNTTNTCNDLVKNIEHIFYYRENDWGYSNFLTWSEVINPEKGYVGSDDSLLVKVKVQADAPHGIDWDSKTHTGFVGLKNQGATCYMNSLLQALYFTNKLRSAVYMLPTETDDEQRSVSLALQRVFYELQFGDKAVGTKRLTKSFGWETLDTFMQHDAQELCRVLLDNLECKMKGTRVEETIPSLFCGRMMSFIRCKTVPVESKREEAFYDIQLKVNGNKDLYQAFDEYVTIETLDGDNKYDAGEFGMQDAEKGIQFVKFPPVLYLQLMRFQYDYKADANIKINDRFEFPYRLNLSNYMQDQSRLSNEQEKGSEETRGSVEQAIYILHTVLVHSGDNHGGHYVAYLNPAGNNEWYKFDDDVVSRCSRRDAIVSNYGGNFEENSIKQCTSAYMLVYMRESEIKDLLDPIRDEDIPANLHQRFANEKQVEDMKRKEKANAHLYSTAILLMDEDFHGWQGYELFDIDRYTYWRKVRYARKSNVSELTQVVAKFLNNKSDRIRLWSIVSKYNQIQLHPLDNKDSLPLLDNINNNNLNNINFNINNINNHNTNNATNSYTTMLYVQTCSLQIPLDRSLPSFDSSTHFLAFLKYYCNQTQTLHYMSWVIYKKSQPISSNSNKQSLCHILCNRAYLTPNTPLIIWEEKERKGLCRINNLSEPLYNPYNGIILLYEQDTSVNNKLQNQTKKSKFVSPKQFANAADFLEDYTNRIEVEFIEKISELTQRTEDNTLNPVRIVIRLSRKSRYMDIVKSLVTNLSTYSLSHRVGTPTCDVSKIQLFRATTTTSNTTTTTTTNNNQITACKISQSQNATGINNTIDVAGNNINNNNTQQKSAACGGGGTVTSVTNKTQTILVPGDPIRTTFDGCLADLISQNISFGSIGLASINSMNATLPRGKPGPPIVAGAVANNNTFKQVQNMNNNNCQINNQHTIATDSMQNTGGLDAFHDDNSNESPPPYRSSYSNTCPPNYVASSNTHALFFRRLKIPITEVETMHQLTCRFTDEHGRTQLDDVSVSLPKSKRVTAADLATEALKQARLISSAAVSPSHLAVEDNWRLFEVLEHRIVSQIDWKMGLTDLQPNSHRIMQLEPKNRDKEKFDPKTELLVSVCHGQLLEINNSNLSSPNHQYKYFGVPFSIRVRDNEPIKELRDRIRQKLEIPPNNKEFDKWNLVIVTSPPSHVSAQSPQQQHNLYTNSTTHTYLLTTNDINQSIVKLAMFTRYEDNSNISNNNINHNCDVIPMARSWLCLDRKVSPVKRPRAGVTEKPIKIHN